MLLKNLKETIEKTILDAQSSIPEQAAKTLADKEISRRAEIAVKAVTTYSVLLSAYDKVNKPDITQFDANGQTVQFTSERRKGEIAKAKKAVTRLEEAFAAALGAQAKWNDLENLLKNPPKDEDNG